MKYKISSVIIFLFLITSCEADFKAEVSNPEPAPTLSPSLDSSKSGWKIYEGDSFSISYPAEVLIMFDIERKSGSQHKIKVNEVKLIDSLRSSNIGKKECIYTNGGAKEFCQLGFESGITFRETDGPISDYTSLIEADGALKSTVNIGGKEFIKSSRSFRDCRYPKDESGNQQEICKEGSDLEIYYIALNDDRTLMIFRTVQEYSKQTDGFPQEILFNEVLSTLIIK